MAGDLQSLVASVVEAAPGLPDPATLASWNPALSGDINIRILRDGTWLHDGEPIQRQRLMRLFASLLRREEDGDYYLVTPAEKWRIVVDEHPLVVVDVAQVTGPGTETKQASGNDACAWEALLNTGGRYRIGGPYALHTEPEPFLDAPSGLSARLTRAAWYRLVEAARTENGRAFLQSGTERIDLGPIL